MNTLPRVLILEGPDGAGKSTLADTLSQLTGFRCVHQSAPVADITAFTACSRSLNAVTSTRENTIFDRFHLSEHVYGPLVRGVDTMKDSGELIERLLWENVVPIVVLCLPPYDITHANWAKRQQARMELIEESETFSAVYFAYKRIRTTLPIIQYDYTRDTAGDLLHRLAALDFIPHP